jgi:chromosome segregation ATPase
MMATPLLVVTSSYFRLVQASQNNQAATSGPAEIQSTVVADSSVEVEQAQTQLKALQQDYRDALAQLQTNEVEQHSLRIAYEDTSDRLNAVNLQNQQLKTFLADRSALKAQLKQLQESNGNLKNQGKHQVEQLTTLLDRLKALENQKLQLTQENQQLQQMRSQLEALKPELAEAHRTIERLSSLQGKKSDRMTMIKVNNQQFSVPLELAEALRAERQQTPNLAERPASEQKPVAIQ